MQVVRDGHALRGRVDVFRRTGATVGFVPTMGALHEGHLSLVRAARAGAKCVVVSIFVNPLQFGPGEDLERYPRDEEGDLALLEKEGVDFVFLPRAEELYPPDFETKVVPGSVARDLEGAFRPGHFTGVCTVVLKLFNLVAPHKAWFGAKDAQQLAVIRRMTRDLSLPVRIEVGPTVREPDGLALSSRNRYLSPEERRRALCLSRGLFAAREAHHRGERSGRALLERAGKEMKEGVVLDYLEIRDPYTFQPVPDPVENGLMLVAARVGSTRLIDNVPLGAEAARAVGEKG